MGIELLIRFLLGGAIVSAFSVLGDVIKPKSFAGIFGAAPSVALATLGIAFVTKGGAHASVEGRSMIVGAIAMVAYNLLASRLLMKRKGNALLDTSAVYGVWLVVALGLWALVLR